MRVPKIPAVTPGRQVRLLFDSIRLEGLTPVEREKIISTLAQILMQAAGLSVEEFEDDKR